MCGEFKKKGNKDQKMGISGGPIIYDSAFTTKGPLLAIGTKILLMSLVVWPGKKKKKKKQHKTRSPFI